MEERKKERKKERKRESADNDYRSHMSNMINRAAIQKSRQLSYSVTFFLLSPEGYHEKKRWRGKYEGSMGGE